MTDSSDPTAVVEARERSSGREARLFRKKPVVIEAMQFTDETKNSVFNWVTCNKAPDWDDSGVPTLKIQTLEGTMTAEFGDWVIKGVKGEFYPCKADIFAMTYEPAEPPLEAHASQAQHRTDGQEQTIGQQGEEGKT